MRNTFQKGVSHSILPRNATKAGISHTFIMHFLIPELLYNTYIINVNPTRR